MLPGDHTPGCSACTLDHSATEAGTQCLHMCSPEVNFLGMAFIHHFVLALVLPFLCGTRTHLTAEQLEITCRTRNIRTASTHFSTCNSTGDLTSSSDACKAGIEASAVFFFTSQGSLSSLMRRCLYIICAPFFDYWFSDY